MKTNYVNKEEPTEVTQQTEKVLKLTCMIENGAKPADSLQQGLQLSLSGDIEKWSEALGRDAIWSRESRVNRLVSALSA